MHMTRSLVIAFSLLAAGCGTTSTPPAAKSVPQIGVVASRSADQPTTSADSAGKGHVVGQGVRTRYAWVRLRQDSYWIRPGDRTRLWLDISASKPIRRYEADWHATYGRLQRWRTDSFWDDNYWTAPDREGMYWLRVYVNIEYADGTLDREWVNEYLRVTK